MIQIVEKYYWILFALLMALIVFFSFWRLDAAYVNSWDEARHGVNAYEMMQNGNYVVNTYGYETDYWNYKPPFSFYGVMLGYKLFGYSSQGFFPVFYLLFSSHRSFCAYCISINQEEKFVVSTHPTQKQEWHLPFLFFTNSEVLL